MAADPTVVRLRRFTVEEYELMGRVGVLAPDERTELLDGVVYRVPPIAPRHASTIDTLVGLFIRTTRDSVRGRNPIRLSSYSEAAPDVLIAHRHRDGYASAHPTAEDALLLVEVADSTVHTARAVKLPIYAAQGIVEVWIVDLAANRVLVHTDPADGAYRTVRELGPGEVLEPTAFPDVTLAVDEVLGLR